MSMFKVNRHAQAPIKATRIKETRSVKRVAQAEVPIAVDSAVVPPECRESRLFAIRVRDIQFLIRLVATSPATVSHNRMMRANILNELLRNRLCNREVLARRGQVELSYLLRVVRYVRRQGDVVGPVFFVEVVLRFRQRAVSFNVPITSMDTGPDFPFRFFNR